MRQRHLVMLHDAGYAADAGEMVDFAYGFGSYVRASLVAVLEAVRNGFCSRIDCYVATFDDIPRLLGPDGDAVGGANVVEGQREISVVER